MKVQWEFLECILKNPAGEDKMSLLDKLSIDKGEILVHVDLELWGAKIAYRCVSSKSLRSVLQYALYPDQVHQTCL